MKLGKAVDLFLGEYLKPTTRHAYEVALVPMRDWIGPARELSDVKPELMIEYFQKHMHPKHYSPATLMTRTKSIKTFFNWCVKLDLLEKSPANAIKAHKPPRRISRDKAMQDGELAALLDFLRYKENPRDFALILFLADSGCRRGGAAGLRLQDIDFAALTAVVTEKGDKSRTVAFSAKCSTAILHWLAYRSAHFKLTGVYVFGRNGEKPKAEYLSLVMRRAVAKVSDQVRSPHSLRHRKGHQLSDRGTPPPVAATAMGITVEVMFAHYYPDDWASAEEALRDLMTVTPEPPKIISFRTSK